MDEHSIGYEVKKSQKANGYNELLELKLWEGSTVTWGANELALATGFKNLNLNRAQLPKEAVVQALKNGNYEHEEIFEMLEIYFKQIDQQTPLSTQPANTLAPDPLLKNADDLDEGLILIALETKLLTA
jgi:hypothetical protein